MFSRAVDQLGVAAEARAARDAVADCVLGHPVADGLDDAGELVADHRRRLRRVWVEPRARHHVGEVDPGRLDAHQHVAGAGAGSGRSWICRTSGPPGLVMTSAFTTRTLSLGWLASHVSSALERDAAAGEEAVGGDDRVDDLLRDAASRR